MPIYPFLLMLLTSYILGLAVLWFYIKTIMPRNGAYFVRQREQFRNILNYAGDFNSFLRNFNLFFMFLPVCLSQINLVRKCWWLKIQAEWNLKNALFSIDLELSRMDEACNREIPLQNLKTLSHNALSYIQALALLDSDFGFKTNLVPLKVKDKMQLDKILLMDLNDSTIKATDLKYP